MYHSDGRVISMKRKTVLITGASRGLGRSLALKFASNSYNLILNARDEKRLSALREEILKSNVNCHLVVGDITDEQTIKNLAQCAEKVGLDILINNAGMYHCKPIDETSPDEIKEVLNLNLVAPILLTQRIFRYFKKKSGGLIININSLAGKNYSKDESVYCASKHGLKGFMGAFQFEALHYNVPIISIFLGAMDTDMTTQRKDKSKFIKTEEVAEFIYNLSHNYKSMRVSEIDILRRMY